MGWKETGKAIGKAVIEKLQEQWRRIQEAEYGLNREGIEYWSEEKLMKEYQRRGFYERMVIKKYLQGNQEEDE